ncbi:hypothetical protein HDU92_002835 [Lobulomyces angularis]|nr:hypothetical protein HDU92_002835 [Lobulomyces angularis]
MTDQAEKTASKDNITINNSLQEEDVWVAPSKANTYKIFGLNFVKILAIGIFLHNIFSTLESSMFGTVSTNLHSMLQVLSLNDLPQVSMMISGVLGPAFVRFAEVYGQMPLAFSGVVLTILSYVLFIATGNPGPIVSVNNTPSIVGLGPQSYCFISAQMIHYFAMAFINTMQVILVTVYIPIRLRATFTSVIFLPTLVVQFIGPMLSTFFNNEWRLMFAVVIPPVFLGFLIMYYPLVKVESKFRKKKIKTSFIQFCNELDIVGAILLIVGVCCALTPPMINYADSFTETKNLVPLIIGLLLLILFIPYEYYIAKYPVFNRRLVTNPTVTCCLIVNALGYGASNVVFGNFQALFQITKRLTPSDAAMLQFGYIGGYAVAALICGLLIQYTRKLKIWIWIGYALYLLAFCLFINTRGSDTSIIEVILVQILAGIGGGISLPAVNISIQAAVKKADVPMAATLLTFTTYLFGPFFGLLASSIWNRYLPVIVASKPGGDSLDLVGIVDTVVDSFKTYTEVQQQIVIDSYLETQRLTTYIGIAMIAIGIVPLYFIKVKNLPAEEQSQESITQENTA